MRSSWPPADAVEPSGASHGRQCGGGGDYPKDSLSAPELLRRLANLFILAQLLALARNRSTRMDQNLLAPVMERIDAHAEIASNLGRRSLLVDQTQGIDLELSRVTLATFRHTDILLRGLYVPDRGVHKTGLTPMRHDPVQRM